MTSAQLSAAFFLQMFVILAICRLVGMIARRLGQPQVVGEMIAGVIMGPSLFGLLFPSWQQVIFPKDSLKLLYVLAQFGVGLYMFLVGTEFKTDLFRSRVRSAVSVSVAGMLAPFTLGSLLALWLWKVPGLFSEKATQFEAVLFLGAAMSITAFPMTPWHRFSARSRSLLFRRCLTALQIRCEGAGFTTVYIADVTIRLPFYSGL